MKKLITALIVAGALALPAGASAYAEPNENHTNCVGVAASYLASEEEAGLFGQEASALAPSGEVPALIAFAREYGCYLF
jgi:hypothetical protein